MKKVFDTICLHMKLSLRSKEVLLQFYIVPLTFYLIMGSVFTSINPLSKETLIQTMTIFTISMGGILGSPSANVEFYGSDSKRAYQVGGIPIYVVALGNFISATVNLLIVSMIIYCTAPMIFSVEIPKDTFQYVFSLLLVIFSTVGIGTVFGLCFKNTGKMGMATQLVFLPSLLLSGIMFDSSMLPSTLYHVGYVLPATWGFRVMTAEQVDFAEYNALFFIITITFGITVIRLKQINQQE